MPLPNLPSQLGRTFTFGIFRVIRVHTRTLFSQRMSTQAQQLLEQCLDRAEAALTHCIGRTQVRAPALRNGAYVLGPFDSQGNPAVSDFSNEFLTYFRLDAAHPAVVADRMDTYRSLCVSIRRGLQGPLDIVDMPLMMQGTRTNGYVRRYSVGGRVEGRGAIHIDLGLISIANIDRVANTLIHEASHKFATAKDHAYEWEMAKWGCLTAQMAIENAESISKFAILALANNLQ